MSQNSESGQYLVHIVLISFKDAASPEVRKELYDRYQTIARECGGREAGIHFFRVGHNLDLRKNVHLVEIAVFRDNESLQAFRVHPMHKELTDILREVADWQVGDIESPAYFLA